MARFWPGPANSTTASGTFPILDDPFDEVVAAHAFRRNAPPNIVPAPIRTTTPCQFTQFLFLDYQLHSLDDVATTAVPLFGEICARSLVRIEPEATRKATVFSMGDLGSIK